MQRGRERYDLYVWYYMYCMDIAIRVGYIDCYWVAVGLPWIEMGLLVGDGGHGATCLDEVRYIYISSRNQGPWTLGAHGPYGPMGPWGPWALLAIYGYVYMGVCR